MADAEVSGDQEVIQFCCVVPECQSRGDGNSMFRIPRNPVLAKIWRGLIFRPEKTDWTDARVCFNHFPTRDYFESDGRRYLIDTAKPSLNIPGSLHRRDVNKCVQFRPEVRLLDNRKKRRVKKKFFCCLCARHLESGKKTMIGDRYTEFGKQFFYFILALKRDLKSCNFCCIKCVRDVEKILQKIIDLTMKFLRTTMMVSGLNECPACGEAWDEDVQKMDKHFEQHILDGYPTDSLSDDQPEPCLAMVEYKEKMVDNEKFQFKPVRFHYKRGKWNPVESRGVLDAAKEQQRVRAKAETMTGECLNCCICSGDRGDEFYTLDDTNIQISIFNRIFEVLIFAPTEKSSRYLCEDCTALLIDVFGDYFYLNVKFRIASRRVNGESLEYALRRGCFQNNCDFIPTSVRQLCSHMADHF